jgi:Tfp pilus assembly protein PilO
MDKKDKFVKKISIRIGLTLLIIGLLLGCIVFVRSLIKNMVGDITNIQKEIAQKSASLNSLVELQSQYRNFGRAYLNVFYNIIPSKDQLINISKELESIALRHNLGFGFSFLNEKKAEGENLGYIQYSLNITGDSINQISQFINDLNNFQYLNQVEDMSATRKTEGEKEVVQSIIKARIYFRDTNIQS